MKTIQISVKIGENEIYRNYEYDEVTGSNDFSGIIEDMLDTLEKSDVKEF